MKQNRNKLITIIGWILFLVALGLVCLQLGYLFVHGRYQVEYIDNRLFYLFNILFAVCLLLAIIFLLRLQRKFLVIGISFVGIFIMLQAGLLLNSNKEIKNYLSISPNLKNVFSIKENIASGEMLYYRSYYGILARPKERLEYKINGEYNIEWLAKDVVAFTYKASDGTIQQFIGTYGDRQNGLSYYYVGAEIHGVWQGDNITVISSPDGITVIEDHESELFNWDDVQQFGTLAIVLHKNDEAVWTIALKENFVVDSNATTEQEGNISLYKATLEKERPLILNYERAN